jgi:hypothetical protein
MLVHLQHDGLLEYSKEGRRRHLHCYRSSPTNFVLELQQVEMEDAGLYWCMVAEWQLDGHPGKWINRASDESQRMALRVLPSGNYRLLFHGFTILISQAFSMLSLPAMYCSFFKLKAIFRLLKHGLTFSL